jgi:CD68 antigen
VRHLISSDSDSDDQGNATRATPASGLNSTFQLVPRVFAPQRPQQQDTPIHLRGPPTNAMKEPPLLAVGPPALHSPNHFNSSAAHPGEKKGAHRPTKAELKQAHGHKHRHRHTHSTEYRAQSTEHRAQSTKHKAQTTNHKAQNTKHKAQSTKHKAHST